MVRDTNPCAAAELQVVLLKLANFGRSESESIIGHLRLTMEKASFGFGLVLTTKCMIK